MAGGATLDALFRRVLLGFLIVTTGARYVIRVLLWTAFRAHGGVRLFWGEMTTAAFFHLGAIPSFEALAGVVTLVAGYLEIHCVFLVVHQDGWLLLVAGVEGDLVGHLCSRLRNHSTGEKKDGTANNCFDNQTRTHRLLLRKCLHHRLDTLDNLFIRTHFHAKAKPNFH